MDRGFHFSKPRFVPPFVPPLCLCYPLFHAFWGLRLATGPAIEKTLRCCRHATTLTSATRSDINNNLSGLKNSEPARLRPVRSESAREYLFSFSHTRALNQLLALWFWHGLEGVQLHSFIQAGADKPVNVIAKGFGAGRDGLG